MHTRLRPILPPPGRPSPIAQAVGRAGGGPAAARWAPTLLLAPLMGLHAPAEAALEVELGTLDGTNGTIVQGIVSYDRLGSAVSGAGDVNGDGIEDLIVGAPDADPGGRDAAGQSYVLFGSADGARTRVRVANLDGISGFAINGVSPADRAGRSVSTAGDLNGDGIGDLLIGARDKSYVVFGSTGGFPPQVELAALDGGNGFLLQGGGLSVAHAGDVNGDGLGDIVIGAERAPNVENGQPGEPGQAFVVFGSQAGFPPVVDLGTLNGANGFVLNGAVGDEAGAAVSGAGDVNGDGLADVLIGAPGAVDGTRGAAFLVHGSAAPFPAAVDLRTLDGNSGTIFTGVAGDHRIGAHVGAAGDINGDGFGDIVIGSQGTSVRLVLGRAGGLGPGVNLSTLGPGTGAVLEGTGGPARGAGDVNGDGLGDLIAGNPYATAGGRAPTGQTYVLFGRGASPFPAAVALPELDGSNGYVLNGRYPTDASGSAVAGTDLNGDGIRDLLIGAPHANHQGLKDHGETYVWFGRAGTLAYHEVTASAGPGGLATPESRSVLSGATAGFVVTADAGFLPDPTVGGTCPPGAWSGELYATGPVSADCAVSFGFTLAANLPPQAVLGGVPAFAGPGAGVDADATGSSDPNGIVAGFSWAVTGPCAVESDPGDGRALLRIAGDAPVTFPATGCRVAVTVTDDGGESATAEQEMLVLPEAEERTMQGAFIAYYGRPADSMGLQFWGSQLVQQGGDLSALITAFGTSAEYIERFSNLSDEALIDGLYNNLFNRPAEADGLAFYLQRLDDYRAEWAAGHGGSSEGATEYALSRIALDVYFGALDGDRTIIENKVEVARYFTGQVIRRDITYDAPDIPAAVGMLQQVTADPASVQAAKGAVDAGLGAF